MPNPKAAVPEGKAQSNFTDPQSRIVKDGAGKGFEQAYNAQIIVAAQITQETNDKKQLVPMLAKVEENVGSLPENVSADAGYFSETNVTAKALDVVNLHIPPDRQRHSDKLGDSEDFPCGVWRMCKPNGRWFV